MRRSLSLWLSILLSFTIIATACGDDGDSSPPDDGSGETDSEGGQTPDAPDTDLETEEGVLDGEQITSAGEGTDDTDLDAEVVELIARQKKQHDPEHPVMLPPRRRGVDG